MLFHQETIKGPLRATASKVHAASHRWKGIPLLFLLFSPFYGKCFDVWLIQVISLCVCFCSQLTESLL